MKKLFLACTVLALVTFWGAPAFALQYGFDNITNNNPGDAVIGEAQLFVDVTDTSGGEDLNATQALFTFSNIGNDQATIFEIYFDDGINPTLLSISSLIEVGKVDFTTVGVSPGDLPGGNELDPAFTVTTGLLAGAEAPQPRLGVSPGETLGVVFDLQIGSTLEDVFDELGNGDLRIGLHVGDFVSGGSESFVNTPPGTPPVEPIPEPSTVLLLGIGLVGVVGLGRKIKK